MTFVPADPESIIWRPQRTRVFTEAMQNPWSRTGWMARDHRAFYATLGGVDRQEEDEDWPVLAPPRPTVRWVETGDTWTWHVDGFEFEQLLERDRREWGEEYATSVPMAREAKAIPRVYEERKVYDVLLEDNVAELDAFDDEIDRTDQVGHWVRIRAWHSRRDFVSPLVSCSDGHLRTITPQRAAWVLEYGSIRSTDRLKRRCGGAPSLCVAPDHHRLIKKRGTA